MNWQNVHLYIQAQSAMCGLPLHMHLSNRTVKSLNFKRPATAIVRLSVKSEMLLKIMSPNYGDFGI